MMDQSQTNHSFARYQLPFILWAIVIFISSSIPGNDLPNIGILNADKIAHFLIFFLFCAFTHRAIKFQDRYPFLARHDLIFSIIITITYGVIDEAHQIFVPSRDSNLRDLAADALGAFLYVGVIWLWSKLHVAKTASSSSD
jgi:VanZ family protein